MKKVTLAFVVVGHVALGQVSEGPGGRSLLWVRAEEAAQRGDFETALTVYQRAYEEGGHNDVNLLKQMATLHLWMREYTEAETLLGVVLEKNPADEEAAATLHHLQDRRGLQFSGSYGEGEIDYTKSSYSVGCFYGGVDWLDLRAGYSQNNRLVYDRSDLWIDAFVFPTYRTYVRIGLRQKNYSYPASAGAIPDNNAYGRVPDYQWEIGHYYFKESYASVEVEYFAPHFYWNNALRADNLKIGGEIRQWIFRPVYARFFAATLRDPNPESVIVEPTSNRITGFGYEHVTLIGGGLGFDNEKVNAEIKYIPDRDLDRSLDWSFFAALQINTSPVRARYDFLYDRYPSASGRNFSWSQVHMVTAIVEPARSLELSIGVKAMVQNITTVLPFATLQLNTGI